MRRKKNGIQYILQKTSLGVFLSLFVMLALLAANRHVLPGELCLYGALPFYGYGGENVLAQLFNLTPYVSASAATLEASAFAAEHTANIGVVSPSVQYRTDIYSDVFGISAVVYRPENANHSTAPLMDTDVLTQFSLADLRQLDFLREHFYTVENTTALTAQDFDIDKFLAADVGIAVDNDLPKILIFHTHSTEFYADSHKNDVYSGIVGVGQKLAQVLRDEYGIPTIHCTERFDFIDGQSQITGAYERMEPVIAQLLVENPSVEIVIDLHRDGLPNNSPKLVTTIDGRETARIMFVNGLTKLLEGGVLSKVDSLPNPNLEGNLAFSFRMQAATNELFPGFARKIYLKAYRYSLHMCPKSLLVEVGAQTNTLSEALNAMRPLAEVLASVVLQK